MKYRTLSAVLERLADGFPVNRTDVTDRVLRCRIVVAGAGSPGCLYDSGPDYFASRRDAIAHLLFIADDGENDAPRGMATALRRDGSYSHNGWRYEWSETTLGSVL
jgi:hypothetical protein